MNKVILIGRLTKDPEHQVSEKSGKCFTKFSVACDRGKDKDGKSLGADFVNCTSFGKTAETIDKYFKKGKGIAIEGVIHTGSYEKDGRKVFTTEVYVDRFDFLPSDRSDSGASQGHSESTADVKDEAHDGFSQMTDDDVPF